MGSSHVKDACRTLVKLTPGLLVTAHNQAIVFGYGFEPLTPKKLDGIDKTLDGRKNDNWDIATP